MILPTPIGKHLGWIEKDRNIDDDDSDGDGDGDGDG